MLRRVTVETGVLEGIPAADPRITAFKGVPFAAPPVGENRWRAPQPAEKWEGVRKCYTFAPISMQHVPGEDPDNLYSREWNVDPEIPMSEDCLYLNVWTPARSADEKLPVFVWYFGGGWQEGNTAEMEFDGERIARRGIVVVTVNYRLNVFGFLAHPELTAQQPDAPTNFGHLDQQAGTRWVQRNIAAFGGDPNNITIGGQSAGGGSVCSQLASPQNAGFCQKAVIMSGIMGSPLPSRFKMGGPLDAAERKGVEFFAHMGVKTLAEARALPAEFVRDKTLDFPQMFATTVDGVFLTAPHLECLMKGKRLPVPLMVSRTSNEFLSTIEAPDAAGMKELAEKTFGEDAGAFLSLVGDDPAKWADLTRFSGVEVAARCLSDRSRRFGIEAPVYYSVFDPTIPGWDDPGTFHSSDLWFWFETFAKCWRAFTGKHFDLARQMCNYLCNFIRSGDPNGKDADGSDMPVWEPLTGDHPAAMRWTDDGAQPYMDVPKPLMQLLMKTWLKSFD